MSSSTLDRSAVINTGPIIALVAARQSLEILPLLYSKLILPRAVWNELMAGGSGCREIKALESLANAVEIPPEDIHVADTRVATLDAGEAAVVQTALDTGISRVIIDEKLGRKVAADCGLKVTGSLGVLVRAKNLGLIVSITPSLQSMARAGVRISPLLRRLALEQAGELSSSS
jgi:predicted nucleic acid-binding protein